MDCSLLGFLVHGIYFPRQEYWNGLPFPSPEDLPDPVTEPGSSVLQVVPPALQVGYLPTEPPWKPTAPFLKNPEHQMNIQGRKTHFCPRATSWADMTLRPQTQVCKWNSASLCALKTTVILFLCLILPSWRHYKSPSLHSLSFCLHYASCQGLIPHYGGSFIVTEMSLTLFSVTVQIWDGML